jgi:hypothetical protein
MFLIPYFIDSSNPNWFKVNVFLCSGGRQIWSVEAKDKVILKMLKDNGFPVLHLKKDQDYIFACIDHAKLHLSDFYTWSEVDPLSSEEDVWRTFLIPSALWTCPVFRDDFMKSSALPSVLASSPLFSFYDTASS